MVVFWTVVGLAAACRVCVCHLVRTALTLLAASDNVKRGECWMGCVQAELYSTVAWQYVLCHYQGCHVCTVSANYEGFNTTTMHDSLQLAASLANVWVCWIS